MQAQATRGLNNNYTLTSTNASRISIWEEKTLIITNVKYFYNGNQTNKGQQFNELSLEKASNMLDTRLVI